MAATKIHSGDINARSQDKLRASIKAAQIIKALSDHILAGLKMTNTQVRAAEILLRKVSPDLLATAISDSRETGLPLLQIVRSPAAGAVSAPPAQPHSKVSDQPEPGPAPAPAVDSAA
jgi:hypothetical protein